MSPRLGLAVAGGLGTQEFGAYGQALGQPALRVGQVPAAPPPTRAVIHTRTVKPRTALYAIGGDGYAGLDATDPPRRQRGAQAASRRTEEACREAGPDEPEALYGDLRDALRPG
ncbi:hypothetical protein ACFVWS_38495 [Streptomyces sp. NPDC058204]|uniref:hypothetical protein n=1 Tax=unclassified Streptomyces TaxID=2593676 RepID=UPI00364A3B84